MGVENTIIGGMTPEEFRLKAKEVADWIKGFCRFGKERLHDEEDYLSVMIYIAIALEGISKVAEMFTDVAEEYSASELKIKTVVEVGKHIS